MIVETQAGRVKGTPHDGVVAFTGIPYAQPPVGPLRFRAPRAAASWTGVREAADFGHIAMQEDSPHLAGLPGRSEDCLVLHVWTPAPDDARRPVMVWLHGGGYGAGVGRDDRSDGTALARAEDVVVVTLNHRLGVFGFLRLDGVDDDGRPDSDNVGMLDIVAALRWVRDNIRAFGGDETNVTVFGMSGGGWKISTLLAMPAARGLFHKGIIQSGSQLDASPLDFVEAASRDVLERVGGLANPAGIPDVPPDRFLEIVDERYNEGQLLQGRFLPDGTFWWNLVFAPTVDGRSLPTHPFRPGAPPESAGVPLLIGTTRDELAGDATHAIPLRFFPELPRRFEDTVAGAASFGLDPGTAEAAVAILRDRRPTASPADIFNGLLGDSLFFMTAVRQLEAKLAAHPDPVYSYRFDWSGPISGGLALHGLDVPFVFGTLTDDEADPAGHELSMRMRSAWAAFARSGDPNHPGLPAWPTYDVTSRATMVFDAESRVENDPGGDLRRVLGADSNR